MFQTSQDIVLSDSSRGRSVSVWSAEPTLGEMLGDPVFRQVMARDRVSLESFTTLVSTVRERLAA